MECGSASADTSCHNWLKLRNNIEIHMFSYLQVLEIICSGIGYILALFGSYLSKTGVGTMSDLLLLCISSAHIDSSRLSVPGRSCSSLQACVDYLLRAVLGFYMVWVWNQWHVHWLGEKEHYISR